MASLKSREKFPPGGFQFFEPATKWRPPAGASFDTAVRLLIRHRHANPFVLKDKAKDYASVAAEVDQFNALRCQSMGWTDFILEGSGPEVFLAKKSLAPLKRVQRLAAGAVAIADFFKSKADAVASAVSAARAGVCAKCPLNESGELEEKFTEQVSLKIRAALSSLREMDLTTPLDDKLHTCAVCVCPMKLKVHFPLPIILKHMPSDVLAELPPHCWIPIEHAESQNQGAAGIAQEVNLGFVDQNPQPVPIADPVPVPSGAPVLPVPTGTGDAPDHPPAD